MRRVLPLLFTLLGTASACVTSPPVPSAPPDHPSPKSVVGVAYLDATKLLVATERKGSCHLELYGDDRAATPNTIPLANCPEGLRRISDDLVLLHGRDSSEWFEITAGRLVPAGRIVDARDRDQWVATAAEGFIWRHAGGETRLGKFGGIRLLKQTEAVLAVERTSGGERIVEIRPDLSSRVIFDEAEEIDSFDVDPKEKEIVVSARRSGSYDVALASLAEPAVTWIAPDAADEISVSWAPRGNKVSYALLADGGTVIRTVHVPTSFQLTVDYPRESASVASWEPAAERFAVVVTSADSSDRVEVVKYGGEEKRVVLPAEITRERAWDQLPTSNGESLILASPQSTRYGEKYPVVVFVRSGNRFAWEDTADEVWGLGNAAISFAREGQNLANAIDALREVPWVDRDRIIVVVRAELERKVTSLPVRILRSGGRIVTVEDPAFRAAMHRELKADD
jgi:hypothetical protein